MKVIPEQALTTRCPMKCGNRKLTTQEATCLGPQCMAWRWAAEEYQCSKCGYVYHTPIAQCNQKKCWANLETIRYGYCGLAGIPMTT